MRQGNMVGKFKVDVGTVYDNFGIFPNLFTFGFWALVSLDKWITFSFFGWAILLFLPGDGPVVFNFLCRTGICRRSNA